MRGVRPKSVIITISVSSSRPRIPVRRFTPRPPNHGTPSIAQTRGERGGRGGKTPPTRLPKGARGLGGEFDKTNGLFGGLHAWHSVALVAKLRNGAIGDLAGAIDAAQRSVFRQAVPWRERKVLAKCHLLG